MALKRLTTERLRSVVTSTDRMSLTIFLAFAFHALLVLGVSFSLPDYHKAQMNTLDITIVTSKTDDKVKDADYLANENQKGGGNIKQRVEAREKFSVQSQHENSGTSTQEKIETSTKQQTQGEKNALTQREADFKLSSKADQKRITAKSENDTTETLKREQDLSMITKELQNYSMRTSRKKLARFLTVNSKKSKDAAYLAIWQKKVKRFGARYYPKEALRKNITGIVTLDVILSPRGVVLRTKVIRSSGFKMLDESARRIVHMASPFPKVPKEVLENKEELHIVHRYKFDQQ